MMQVLVGVFLFVCSVLVGIGLGMKLRGDGPGNAEIHSVAALTAGQVQRIAELATLRVPIAEVRITEVTGRLGGCRMLLAVRGEAVIYTDASKAVISPLGEGAWELTLPMPEVRSIWIDHRFTRIYSIDRSGFWRLWPGSEIEAEGVSEALRCAQEALENEAKAQNWIAEGQRHAEALLRSTALSVGARIEIRWTDSSVAP